MPFISKTNFTEAFSFVDIRCALFAFMRGVWIAIYVAKNLDLHLYIFAF